MKHLVVILSTSLLAACGQESAILPVPAQTAGQATAIEFVTSVEPAAIALMQARIFPKYEPTAARDFSTALKNNPANPERYLAEISGLQAGEYRVAIRLVYYQRLFGIELIRYTRVYTRDFMIHAPLSADCFRFDDKLKDVMGWSTTPVYLSAREQPVSASGCHGVFFANQGWPSALTDSASSGGSLFIPVSNKCFPSATSNVLQPGYWYFTLSSPSLEQRPAWQNLKAIQFRVATKSINVDIKPEIVSSSLPSGQLALPTGTKATPAGRYTSYPGNWRVIEHPVNLPKGSTIKQLRLQISGIPEETVKETVDAILIDGICPIK